MSPPALLTYEEQAKALNITPRFLRTLVKRRRIPVIRLGRAVRFNPVAVERAIEAMTTREFNADKPTRRGLR